MDSTVGLLIVVILIAIAAFFGVRWFIRANAKYAGTKIVTCPETHRPASVEVDALHAALTAAVGATDIRLQHCSRWPINENCGQECLVNLDVAPEECLVSGVLMKWYRGKKCLYCGVTFEGLDWTDHKPALQSPAGGLLRWNKIAMSDLSTVLDTYRPVCWNCYVAQSFIAEHPDLVVYRPWKDDIHQPHRTQ